MHKRISVLFLALAAATCAMAQSAPHAEPPQPLPIADWRQKRVMFISAHPDDIEAAAGGLVEFVIFTNGDKGCSNPICMNSSSEEIAAARRLEAFNAASVLGVKSDHVHLLGYEDSMLASYDWSQLRSELVAHLRRFKPHICFAWHPYPNFMLRPMDGWFDLGYHTDHQHSGLIALASVTSSGVGRLYPYTGLPHQPEAFYLFEFLKPTHYVDIGGALAKKIASWQQHKTQYPTAEWVQQAFTQLGSRVANNTAGFAGHFAEAFYAFH